MKRLILFFLICILCVNLASASVCEAGNTAILDYDDSIQGWIDTQPPAQECIFGNYGAETCTSDPNCDGKYTNTYSCNAGVGVAYCDNDCGYTLIAPLCNIECSLFTDPICDGLAPGTGFADPDGDGTRDYCGDGPMNYYCHHVDTNVCNSTFGASVECDGQTVATYFTGSSGADDYCDNNCQYFDCIDGVSGMCGPSQVCQSNTCVFSKILDINGGEEYTNSKFVTLNISFSSSIPGMTCRFGNNQSEILSALWEPCISTKSWILSSGDGEKEVYIEINSSGTLSQSNDTIILESLPHAISFITPQSNSFLSQSVPLKIATSGDIYQVEYFVKDSYGNQFDLLGNPNSSTIDNNVADGWNQTWSLSSFSTGRYNITVRAYDRCYLLFHCVVAEDTVESLYFSRQFSTLNKPIVYDGIIGSDIDFSYDNTSLSAHWENNMNLFFSNIYSRFKVYENGTCLAPYCDWVEVGTQQSIMLTNLSLVEGNNYSFEVMNYIVNPYIKSPTAMTDGVVIDMSLPYLTSLNSSSHPNQTEFYADADPLFEWLAEDNISTGMSGIKGYSIVLDRVNNTIPDTIVDLNATSYQYFGIGDGVWYFHIRPIDQAANAGTTWHYQINIINDGVDIYFDKIYSPVEESTINISGYVTGPSNLELYLNEVNIRNGSVDDFNLSNGKYLFNFSGIDIIENATSVYYMKAITPNGFVTVSPLRFVRQGETNYNGEALSLKVEYDTGSRNPIVLDSGKVTYDTSSDMLVGLATEDDDYLADNATGGSDFVSLEANVRERPIYLFFSTPSKEEVIKEKDNYFEDKDFVNLINPTFGDLIYDNERHFIGTELSYDHIVLSGNRKLPVGRYTLIIENNGVDAYGNPVLDMHFE